MAVVTLSSKFQIVIPQEVREARGWKAGMKLELLDYGGVLKLVPVQPLEEMFGSLPGLDTTIDRGEDRF